MGRGRKRGKTVSGRETAPRRRARPQAPAYAPSKGAVAAERLVVIREEVEAHEASLQHLVAMAAAAGNSAETIAAILGVSRATLYRRFSPAIRAGVAGRPASV